VKTKYTYTEKKTPFTTTERISASGKVCYRQKNNAITRRYNRRHSITEVQS